MRDDLTLGYHILARHGHEHLRLGHVSMRGDGADSLWIKRIDASLADVASDRLLLVDFAGNVLEGSGGVHVEVPIHAEILRARPDVNAVVHSHALEAAALASSVEPLRMVSQHGIFFAEGIGNYSSSELVTTRERGEALARALGGRRAVLLRNHGLVTVGASVREAVVLAVSFVANLRIQCAAASLGGVVEMHPDDVSRMADDLQANYPQRIERLWRALRDDL